MLFIVQSVLANFGGHCGFNWQFGLYGNLKISPYLAKKKRGKRFFSVWTNVTVPQIEILESEEEEEEEEPLIAGRFPFGTHGGEVGKKSQ